MKPTLLSAAPGTGDTAMSQTESLLPESLTAQGWTDSKNQSVKCVTCGAGVRRGERESKEGAQSARR